MWEIIRKFAVQTRRRKAAAFTSGSSGVQGTKQYIFRAEAVHLQSRTCTPSGPEVHKFHSEADAAVASESAQRQFFIFTNTPKQQQLCQS